MWKFLRNNFDYKSFWGFYRISQNCVDYNASINVKKQVNSLYTHLQKGMELFCNNEGKLL